MEENIARSIVLIVGARKITSLYMIRGLIELQRCPNVRITVAITNVREEISEVVRRGEPADFVPRLAKDDVVYAAGAPAMVDQVARLAARADAEFYCDPFEPSDADIGDGFLGRTLRRMRGFVQPDPVLSARPSAIDDVRMRA